MLEADLSFAQYYTTHTTDYNTAMFYAKNALELGRTWGFSYFQAGINFTLGSVYLAKKEFANALPLLQNGARLAKGRYTVTYTKCLRNLAQAYSGTGNWQQAYKYSDTLATVTDSLNKVNTDKGFADAEARYQNKEQQQQIEGHPHAPHIQPPVSPHALHQPQHAEQQWQADDGAEQQAFQGIHQI